MSKVGIGGTSIKRAKADTEKRLPIASQAKAQADAACADAEKALALIKQVKVVDGKSIVQAVDVIRDVKTQKAETDEVRKKWVGPFTAVVDDINGFFRPALTALKEAEADLKHKVGTCILGMRLAADGKLAEVEAAVAQGDTKKSDALIRQAQELEPPKIKGVSITEKWDVEVIDASQVPDQYKIPDVSAISAAAKAVRGDPKIPGCKVTKRLAVSVGQE